ncbi:hypothetical protein P4E94_15930 [Pontiellaceae bacterium B12219]|nr:hypothetical protein [Pontiellaceae bacterium B12219]
MVCRAGTVELANPSRRTPHRRSRTADPAPPIPHRRTDPPGG